MFQLKFQAETALASLAAGGKSGGASDMASSVGSKMANQYLNSNNIGSLGGGGGEQIPSELDARGGTGRLRMFRRKSAQMDDSNTQVGQRRVAAFVLIHGMVLCGISLSALDD